jgi:monoamine oxidase
MNETNILIIGAGAAGLMAARELTQAGKKVIILEARDRCGGRIYTIQNLEFGAEFIHGNLPLTLNLLKEAGVETTPVGGEMVHYHDDRFGSEGSFMEGWNLLMEKLGELKADTTINQFLEAEFADQKYDRLKASVRRFAAGFDNADPDKASAFALRSEWGQEEDEGQHRIKGGYGKMIGFLAHEVEEAGGKLFLNTLVKQIDWQPGKVKAITADGTVYAAEKMIVALPLGVLQADKGETAAITFNPPIPKYIEAANKIGFGAVIKILLEFDAPFWEDKQTEVLAGKSLKNMGFILSDEEIPAWWTQAPNHSPLLTGWLGGPAARAKKDVADKDLLQLSLASLGNIFKRSIDELKGRLISSHVVNWTTDPFALGSYAYDMVESHKARKMLDVPVENTLFFAGEYVYEGPVMGTVEAALISGKEAAGKVLA